MGSAYLIAFQYLGYEFIFTNRLLTHLRYQLSNPDEDVFPIESVLFRIDLTEECIGMNIVTTFDGRRYYFIVFDIEASGGTNRRIGVMLPSPYEVDINIFKKMNGYRETEINISHFEIQFKDKLTSPKLASILWNSI